MKERRKEGKKERRKERKKKHTFCKIFCVRPLYANEVWSQADSFG